MKFNMLPHSVGVLKLIQNLLVGLIFKGENYLRALIWYIFDIGLRPDAREPLCFKLGMMLDMNRLYSMIPIWITLTSSQSHRVIGKLELLQS